MKYFVALLVASTIACACSKIKPSNGSKPEFKPGDCIILTKYMEKKWEQRFDFIIKVVGIGPSQYETKTYDFTIEGNIGTGHWGSALPFADFNYLSTKSFNTIQCPDGSGPVVPEPKEKKK